LRERDSEVRWVPIQREPAVREAPDTFEHAIGAAAHPDRNPPRRPWLDAGERDAVEAALEVHDRFLEEASQEEDLLLYAAAPGVEVLTERFVLDGVPPDAYSQAEASLREDLEISRLFRDERRLALRQDDDRRHEFQERRHRREVREEHERLGEGRLVIVG